MKAQGRAATAGGAYRQLLEVVWREAVRSKSGLVDGETGRRGDGETSDRAYHQLLEVVRREAVRSKADLVDLALLRIERVRRILGVVPEQTVPERRGYR